MQKSPIKGMIFCKKRPMILRSLLTVAIPLWNERERERERENISVREKVSECIRRLPYSLLHKTFTVASGTSAGVWACVCEREREREGCDYRSLLRKSPLKETKSCKRDL